jgi:hypothetical protein
MYFIILHKNGLYVHLIKLIFYFETFALKGNIQMSCRIIPLIYYISQIIAFCPQEKVRHCCEYDQNLSLVFLQIPEFLKPGKYKSTRS